MNNVGHKWLVTDILVIPEPGAPEFYIGVANVSGRMTTILGAFFGCVLARDGYISIVRFQFVKHVYSVNLV